MIELKPMSLPPIVSVTTSALRVTAFSCGGAVPKPVVLDTANLLFSLPARKSFLDPERTPGDPELNLTAARRALGLPDYPAHDALTDAVATAELFLVVRHRLGARRLRDLR